MILRFVRGVVLPIRGSVFLLRHRRLLVLALVPLLLNAVLYVIAAVLFIRYFDAWFGLILEQPETWYWLIGYYTLRLLAFLLGVAVFLFSFVFAGRILAAPFLDPLSAQTEAILLGRTDDRPTQLWQVFTDTLRAVGHTVFILFLLLVAFPLNFIPVVGQAGWVALGWLLLVFEFTSFVMDRRRWSFRMKWQRLRADLVGALGFGAALFVLMAVPLVGLVMLPVATVAGTMFVIEHESPIPSRDT